MPDFPHRLLVEAALKRQPVAVVTTTVRLWQQLAPELISIIGEGGFSPLYARSMRLAGVHHPWLPKIGMNSAVDLGFMELQASLQAQDADQAGQGSLDLFNIFLDLLGSLIGETLTTHLLHSAWSKETSEPPTKDSST